MGPLVGLCLASRQRPVSAVATVGRIRERLRFTRVEGHSPRERALCDAVLVRQASGHWMANACEDPNDLDSFEILVISARREIEFP